MVFLSIFLLALATVVPTQAFTNGSSVPANFCNPDPDGMPKSLGQLLPYLLEDNPGPIAFNNNYQFPPYLSDWPSMTDLRSGLQSDESSHDQLNSGERRIHNRFIP